MPFLTLPSEIRLCIYDAILSPLLAVPEHYNSYVLPEEWRKKSFASYHSLLLTCKNISAELKHLLLSVYVNKITLFFDDCPELYLFAERLCAFATQGRRLQDMRLSLRCPEQALWPLGLRKGAYSGTDCCISNTIYFPYPMALPINPMLDPVTYLVQNKQEYRRGRTTIFAGAFQGNRSALSSLHLRGVPGAEDMLECSMYVELRSTFAELDWYNWVRGASDECPRQRGGLVAVEERRATKLKALCEEFDTPGDVLEQAESSGRE